MNEEVIYLSCLIVLFLAMIFLLYRGRYPCALSYCNIDWAFLNFDLRRLSSETMHNLHVYSLTRENQYLNKAKNNALLWDNILSKYNTGLNFSMVAYANSLEQYINNGLDKIDNSIIDEEMKNNIKNVTNQKVKDELTKSYALFKQLFVLDHPTIQTPANTPSQSEISTAPDVYAKLNNTILNISHIMADVIGKNNHF